MSEDIEKSPFRGWHSINNYGMQIWTTSDLLAISQKLPIANIQKKNTVKWLIQYTSPDEDFENCRTRQRY